MSTFEKFTGRQAIDLIQDLIKGKTLVKVSIHTKDFERRTVLLSIQAEEDRIIRFQIDPPEGLWIALLKLNRPILRFEFLGQDHLPHRFEVPFDADAAEGWLPCPEVIERYQLRNDFRVKAPANAYASALINEAEFKMALDNISLGGIFCHCPNSAKALLFKDQIIESLSLVFTFGGEYQIISIDRAVVRRIEGRTHQRHFGVAFEFAVMNADVKNRLAQLLNGLQREYLQNQLKEER